MRDSLRSFRNAELGKAAVGIPNKGLAEGSSCRCQIPANHLNFIIYICNPVDDGRRASWDIKSDEIGRFGAAHQNKSMVYAVGIRKSAGDITKLSIPAGIVASEPVRSIGEKLPIASRSKPNLWKPVDETKDPTTVPALLIASAEGCDAPRCIESD